MTNNNKNVADFRSQLMAARSDKQPTQRDAVAIFLAKMDAQMQLAKDAAAGKEVNPRATWFKRVGDSYTLKIGRDAMDMGEGARHFTAPDLQGIVGLLELAKSFIQTDGALKQKLIDAANARSQRVVLRKAEAKPAAK